MADAQTAITLLKEAYADFYRGNALNPWYAEAAG